MDIQHYARLWSEGKGSRPSAESFWDKRADEFNKFTTQGTPDERTKKILHFVSQNGLLTPNSCVLDIGCGPGKFAVEFAKTAAEVTGLDISAKMLAYAQENADAAKLANVSFKNLNWDDVNLDEYGWRNKFDLVAAINSPGIHDPGTLEKMSAASKGYCFLANFVERSDSVQDVLRTEVLKHTEARFYVNTIYCIFNILWLTGYFPHITYVDTDREQAHTVEEAYFYYSTLLVNERDSVHEQKALIKNYLDRISLNGFVKERVRTKTAWIFWKVC